MTRLGQHFLINPAIVGEIINSLALGGDEIIIEIGPGHGELTDEYVYIGRRQVYLIERDKVLVEILREKYASQKNVKIITGDAVEIIQTLVQKNIKNEAYKLFGNIPYYITGALLRKISELKNKPKLLVFLVQKEVAERLAAKPPKMNLLSAATQVWSSVEIIRQVPKADFKPVPKVDSAIIILKTIARRRVPAAYYATIKALFKQPRKTILNNFKDGLNLTKKAALRKLGGAKISANLRPQDLTIEDILRLVKAGSRP